MISKHQADKDCVFCEMFKNNVKDFLVIEPLNPVVDGHLLVIPREHVTDFTDNLLVTAKTVEMASLEAKRRGGSYNLIISKGKEATQSVFHLHVHLVPRRCKDNLSLPWSFQKHNNKMEEIAKEVKAVFKKRCIVNRFGELKYWKRDKDNNSPADSRFFPQELLDDVLAKLAVKKEDE